MGPRIAASARLENAIDALLIDGLADPDKLGELGRLGAQLVIQRAIEDEVAVFLGRSHSAELLERTH